MQLEYIWITIILICFLLSIKNTTFGCSILIYTRILVPEVVRLTPFFDISLNTGVIVIITLSMIRDFAVNRKCLSKLQKNYYFRAITIFSLLLLITIVLGNCLNFNNQILHYVQFLITEIIPIVVVLHCCLNNGGTKLITTSLLIAVFINTIYGIATTFVGINPYAYLLNIKYAVKEEMIASEILESRGGIIGTSSTFAHANIWGTFLPLAFVLHFYYYRISKQGIYLVATILLSICVFLSTKRSAILTFILFWVAYFFISSKRIKTKILSWGVLLLLTLIILLYLVPQLSSAKDIVESTIMFWDDSLREKNNVGGSSMELRISQVFYPWVEADNILFGRGFGFCNEYLKQYTLHPILMGFETIFSTAVCEGGLFGVIIWFFFFRCSYIYSKNRSRSVFPFLMTFVAVVISIATGLSVILFYCVFIILMCFSHELIIKR